MRMYSFGLRRQDPARRPSGCAATAGLPQEPRPIERDPIGAHTTRGRALQAHAQLQVDELHRRHPELNEGALACHKVL